MPVRGNPAQITEKWKTRTAGATQQVVDGVNRVTEAPTAKAARQKQAWINNTIAKQDKWERNTAAVTLEEWRAATTAGAQRIAAGVNAKAGKMERFMTEFVPFLEGVQRQVNQTPRGDMETNLARMVQNARLISQFKRGVR
jgi:hypothetical protein